MRANGVMVCVLMSMISLPGLAKDKKDRAFYETKKNFYDKDKEYLVTDYSPYEHVRSIEAYNPVYHTPPIRQDTTSTCWCFCTTSFLESELHRLGKGDYQLSRMYTVYWEYIEKIRRFIQQKGESLVAEGSQPNAVINIMKKYGAVRASDYSGFLGEATVHDHRELHKEILAYLDYVREHERWFEDEVLAHIKLILNRHLGAPPQMIVVDGVEMSPKEFMSNVLQLPLDEYVSVMSFKKMPFWTQDSYDVPDNWWHSKEYYNVPINDFCGAITQAIRNNYSLVIMGDVSEPGKHGWQDIGIIPSFDIPSEYIDQDSREFRFYNKTSTDDHGMHLIGYKRYKGEDWFLIKDSAASAWNGEFPGYHFFHQDYLKLKVLAFMTHRDAIPALLDNMRKIQTDKNFTE